MTGKWLSWEQGSAAEMMESTSEAVAMLSPSLCQVDYWTKGRDSLVEFPWVSLSGHKLHLGLEP